MVNITVTKTVFHSAGDQRKVVATVSVLDNAYTYRAPLRIIEDWGFTCTIDDSAGGVVTEGNLITFAAGAAITGTLTLYGR